MKKSVLVLMILLLTAAFVFAGGGNQAKAPAGPADYGARTTGANYWWVKSPQTVTLHTVNEARPNTPFMPGDDVTKNEWTRGFKEALNVEIVTDWVAATNGYTEKLNLAIASNEIPDVFFCNATQFRQLVEAGIAADLTDYIDNNASDMVKNIMAAAPIVTNTAKFNGRLMGIPRYGYGDLWNVYDLWIRHDWLQQSGLKEPQSIDELEKIMDAFMRAHPGSYGIGVRKTLDEFFWVASAFGALPKIWIEAPDGSLVYGSIQPEMKGALEKFADWYKRGYLRRDFTSIDERDIINDIAAEKLGVHVWGNWAGWSYVDVVRALGMNAYMEPYEIPSGNGKPHIHPIPIDNSEYIVINKNCRNIAAAIKCISYHAWVCMEATIQGALTDEQVERYLLRGEGRHDVRALALNDPYGNGPPLVEWAHKIGLNNYRITEPPMTSEWPAQYEQAAPWWRDNSPEGYGRWIQQYYAGSSAWYNLKVMNEGRYVATKMTGSYPEDVLVYGTTLVSNDIGGGLGDDLLVEGFTKIIVGQEPISYFDRLIAEWKSSGGDVVTRAVNREYGKK